MWRELAFVRSLPGCSEPLFPEHSLRFGSSSNGARSGTDIQRSAEAVITSMPPEQTEK